MSSKKTVGRVEVFSREDGNLALDFGKTGIIIEQSSSFFSLVAYSDDEYIESFLGLLEHDFTEMEPVFILSADFQRIENCITKKTLWAKATMFKLLVKHFSSKMPGVHR